MSEAKRLEFIAYRMRSMSPSEKVIFKRIVDAEQSIWESECKKCLDRGPRHFYVKLPRMPISTFLYVPDKGHVIDKDGNEVSYELNRTRFSGGYYSLPIILYGFAHRRRDGEGLQVYAINEDKNDFRIINMRRKPFYLKRSYEPLDQLEKFLKSQS